MLHGDLSTLYRVNLWTRLATRVLVRIGTVRALHFEELRRKTSALPIQSFVRSAVRLRVSATAHRCRLIHTGAIIERVELALADAGLTTTLDEAAPLLQVFIRGDLICSRCPSIARVSYCTVVAIDSKMAAHRCVKRWHRHSLS